METMPDHPHGSDPRSCPLADSPGASLVLLTGNIFACPIIFASAFCAFLMAAVVVAPGTALASDTSPAAVAMEQQDYETVLRLSAPLAEAGDPVAQYRMGMLYRFGWGVDRDFAAAREWFQKAAHKGNGSAASELGKIYKDGRGLDKDPAEAVKWFRIGAHDGLGIAQLNLARMVRDGKGIAADPVEAHAWFSLAIDNQYMDAIGHRNRMQADMTPEQIAAAKARATELRKTVKPRTPEDQ